MSFDPASIQGIVRIGAIILGLILAWGLLKLIFRLAKRVFNLGCFIIMAIAVILVILHFIQ